MPRTVKSKATTGAKAVKRRRRWSVEHTPVDSTALIEVGPDHHYWTGHAGELAPRAGAIVKIVPPPGTPEADVIALERSFYDGGALSVKVMPTQEDEKVTIEGETFDFSQDDERSLRQVVMDRADRATNARDLDALKALLTKAMDHAEATS